MDRLAKPVGQGVDFGIRPGVLGKDQRRFFRMMRVSIAEETGEGHRYILSSMRSSKVSPIEFTKKGSRQGVATCPS